MAESGVGEPSIELSASMKISDSDADNLSAVSFVEVA